MRGKVAKRIRREIYGEQSLQIIRKYRDSVGLSKTGKTGGIVNIGLRQEYLDAKKDYYLEKKGKTT